MTTAESVGIIETASILEKTFTLVKSRITSLRSAAGSRAARKSRAPVFVKPLETGNGLIVRNDSVESAYVINAGRIQYDCMRF